MSLLHADEPTGQGIGVLPVSDPASLEASLVEAAKSGDSTAFEALAERYGHRLRRVAQRITHNREDAEDAVQGSLLQAFVHLRSFRGDSQFSSWLGRIVANEALMKLRKDQRRKEVSLGECSGTEDAYSAWNTADLGPSPEEHFSRLELQRILMDMIEELDPNLRIVLHLRYARQFSTNAAARILNLPVPTVKARLHRARLKLRQILETRMQRSARVRVGCYEPLQALRMPEAARRKDPHD